jgi:hypothetical protein
VLAQQPLLGHDSAAMHTIGNAERLDIDETRGLLVIRAQDSGEFQVTGQGHLRIPDPYGIDAA